MSIFAVPALPFDQAALEAANRVWGCNCGPAALAAIAGLSLDTLRPYLVDFEAKGFTNPTMMWSWLRKLDLHHQVFTIDRDWPFWGLARIQFEGRWTRPGVPARVAYGYTHWVAACKPATDDVHVFDVNAVSEGGWLTLADWREAVVPAIVETIKGADGKWHITHSVEVARKVST